MIARRQVFLALTTGALSLIAEPAFAAPEVISAEKLAGVRRVSIISALGDRAAIQKYVLLHGGGTSYLPIEDWQLDELVISTASAALASRFDIVPFAYDKKIFVHRDGGLWGFGESPLVTSLVRSLPKSDIDAYLVVQSHPFEFGPGVWLEGVGAVQGPPGIGRFYYAEYEVVLIRATTGKAISWHYADMRDPRGTNSFLSGVDMVAVPESAADWADNASKMTDDQKQRLRDNIRALVSESLVNTLRRMGLADM